MVGKSQVGPKTGSQHDKKVLTGVQKEVFSNTRKSLKGLKMGSCLAKKVSRWPQNWVLAAAESLK
jgi:hypothetical protein